MIEVDQSPRDIEFLTDYQNAVVRSRRNPSDSEEDWRAKHADFFLSEYLELLTQHGNDAFTILCQPLSAHNMQPIYDRNPTANPNPIRFNMADELGDQLWFSFNTIQLLEHDPRDVIAAAYKEWSGEAAPLVPQTFSQIETLATEHARQLCVLPKPGSPDPERHISLEDNTVLVFTRTTARLALALDPSRPIDAAQPTAADRLPLLPVDIAIGQHLLTCAYIASRRLCLPLSRIAAFNIAKQDHRRTYGKSTPFPFDQSWASQP